MWMTFFFVLLLYEVSHKAANMLCTKVISQMIQLFNVRHLQGIQLASRLVVKSVELQPGISRKFSIALLNLW